MKRVTSLFLLLAAGAFAKVEPVLEDAVNIQYFGEAMGQVLDYLPKPDLGSHYFTSFHSMGDHADVVLSLRNPTEREALIEMNAFTDAGILRFMVKLQPDEEMLYDLYDIGEMSALAFTSLSPYQAVLFDLADERKVGLVCTKQTYGSPEELKRVAAQQDKGPGTTPQPGDLTCAGTWTLTGGSFSKTASGTVIYLFGPGYITWGNNRSSGSWRTRGVDGDGNTCYAYWSPDSGYRCPWKAVDCLGNSYNIYGTRPR